MVYLCAKVYELSETAEWEVRLIFVSQLTLFVGTKSWSHISYLHYNP